MRTTLLTAVLFILISTAAYAQTFDGFAHRKVLIEFQKPKDHRWWVSAQFSGMISMNSLLDTNVQPFSKFGLNIGASVYKFIALEASMTYNIQQKVNLQFSASNKKVVTSLGQADISLSLLLQPSFMLSDYPVVFIKPYVGGGFNFAFIPEYSYIPTPISATTINGYGAVIKAGVRFTIQNFLIGVRAEYLILNSKYEQKNYDLSTIAIGVEIGGVF